MAIVRKRLDSIAIRRNSIEIFRGRMPVEEAAARVGCRPSAWYKWERGDSFPVIPYVWRIEELFTDINAKPVSYREIWPQLNPSLKGLE